AAARVRCLPRGRDRGVGRDRPPDRPRESRPKRPVVTGLRLVIPRAPWPRLGSERATRVVMATIYALVLLVALAEVARSLARADRLDYAYYPKLGEVVLSGGDPYANAFNTWPPFFLLVAAGLALGSRVSAAGTLFAWQLASVLAVWGTLKLLARFGPGEAAAQWREWRAVAAAEMVQPVAHHPNQALLSALKRLLTVEGGASNPLHYALAASPTTAVVRLFWLVAAVAGLGLAFAFRGSSRDLRDPRCAGEFAVCLGAMTLVSPLAWAAHFVTLVAP